MTKVQVKREDLRSLLSGGLITNFQHSILVRFFFNNHQLDKIAKDCNLPQKSIISTFNKGYSMLSEFHRLRLRNLKNAKNSKL